MVIGGSSSDVDAWQGDLNKLPAIFFSWRARRRVARPRHSRNILETSAWWSTSRPSEARPALVHRAASIARRVCRARLRILAFPCNQFLSQEPQCAETIEGSITKKYSLGFPIMQKVKVNRHTHPIFRWLRLRSAAASEGTADPIHWNFTLFLSGAARPARDTATAQRRLASSKTSKRCWTRSCLPSRHYGKDDLDTPLRRRRRPWSTPSEPRGAENVSR